MDSFQMIQMPRFGIPTARRMFGTTGRMLNESARAALDPINVRARTWTAGEYMHATTEMIDGKPNGWQQQGVRAKQRCASERLLDELEGRPRVWMEVLESRRMLSDGFGVNGWSTAKFGGHPGMALPDAMAEAPDGKIYAVGDV